MKSRTVIRMATEHDLSSLLHLEEIAFDIDRFTRDQIDYLLTRSRATIFILENRSGPIGAGYLLWRKSHPSARLYNIAVDPQTQGRGYGARLLRECELEAAYRGCGRITLEVRRDNEGAISFYEHKGFTIVGHLPDYYEDGMAGLKMAKILRRRVPAAIRLDIPYYAQTLDFTCGAACVMMALKYFQPQRELGRALEMLIWKEATSIFMASGFGGTDGYGLALSAVGRGVSSRLIISMETTPMLKSVRSAKKREVMRIVHNDLKRRARRAGVSGAVYEYDVDDIVSALHRGMIPIAMISTYRLTGDRVPHWVVVTGCDDDYLYIHDPDIASYKKNRARASHLRVAKDEFTKMSRYGKEVYRCLLLMNRPSAKV